MFRIIELIYFQTIIVKKIVSKNAFFENFFLTILVWKWIKSMILNTFYSIELFHKMSSSMCFLASKVEIFFPKIVKKTQKNAFFEKVVLNKKCLEWSITYDSEEFWGFMWAQITKNYFYWGKSEVDVKI